MESMMHNKVNIQRLQKDVEKIMEQLEVTEKLGDLQEKMKRLKEVPNTAPKNVTNALFVGSTAELQKVLKDKK